MKYYLFAYRAGNRSGIHYVLADSEEAAAHRVRSRIHHRWPSRKVTIRLMNVEAA